jgi:hypothetical protein
MSRAAFLLSGLAVLAIALPTTSHAQSGPNRRERPDPIKELMPRPLPQGDFWRPEELRRLQGDPLITPAPLPEPAVPAPPAKTR